jgi:hypothetical protein
MGERRSGANAVRSLRSTSHNFINPPSDPEVPDAVVGAAFLVTTAGHIISEQQRLTSIGRWDDLHRELAAFVLQRAEYRGDHIELPLDYLLAKAVK